jgi:hypothetical protein
MERVRRVIQAEGYRLAAEKEQAGIPTEYVDITGLLVGPCVTVPDRLLEVRDNPEAEKGRKNYLRQIRADCARKGIHAVLTIT